MERHDIELVVRGDPVPVPHEEREAGVRLRVGRLPAARSRGQEPEHAGLPAGGGRPARLAPGEHAEERRRLLPAAPRWPQSGRLRAGTHGRRRLLQHAGPLRLPPHQVRGDQHARPCQRPSRLGDAVRERAPTEAGVSDSATRGRHPAGRHVHQPGERGAHGAAPPVRHVHGGAAVPHHHRPLLHRRLPHDGRRGQEQGAQHRRAQRGQVCGGVRRDTGAGGPPALAPGDGDDRAEPEPRLPPAPPPPAAQDAAERAGGVPEPGRTPPRHGGRPPQLRPPLRV